MLKIFNDLEPFFRDNYQRINVREYARIRKMSPPSASALLSNLEKEGLLNVEKEKNYIYYHANREDREFIELSRIYWHKIFQKTGLIKYFEKELIEPIIILFGSFSKAEIKKNSDIDLAVFTFSTKKLETAKYEKVLGRKIQIFTFKDKNDIKNKELLNNILNGYKIIGGW